MHRASRGLAGELCPERLDAEIDGLIAKLDDVSVLRSDLAAEDVETIGREMAEGPFLSRVRRQYPFLPIGRRKNLERRDRYADYAILYCNVAPGVREDGKS